LTLAKSIEAHGLTELDWFIDGLFLLGNKDDEDDKPAKDDEDNEPARKKPQLCKPCKPSRPASLADPRLDQDDEQPDKEPDKDELSEVIAQDCLCLIVQSKRTPWIAYTCIS
jgi:hypothetical protein